MGRGEARYDTKYVATVLSLSYIASSLPENCLPGTATLRKILSHPLF